MKYSSFAITLLLCIFLSNYAISQEEKEGPQTLREQFREMLDKSETYTEYKVVKRTSLSAYSRSVQDSISAFRNEISALKNQVSDQKSQINQLSKQIDDLKSQLDKSESLRESISFLGINFNKATYHIFVWVIIGGLAGFGVFAYSSFVRSNKVTAKSKKEIKEIELEYEEHKKRSHEKQIKMGRELQTERNNVEELRTKLKAKP